MLVRRSVVCSILLALMLAGSAWAQEDTPPVRYDGYQVVRVRVAAQEQLEALHALGARCLNDSEGVGTMDYLLPPGALTGLQAITSDYKVLNENLQKSIDEERAQIEAFQITDARDPTWFQAYKNIDQVNARLNAMVADRPDLVTLIDAGTTIQGRHIYGVKITGPGANKPAIEFNGCHHAREWISVMVPMWIADRLVYEYDTNPTFHTLVNSLEFYIIPVVNVDGYVYTWTTDRQWRKNRRLNSGGCYGVDLNRNYAVGFGGGGSSGSPCDETYRGTAAFSEPESAAMRDFAIAHPNLVATQSYHSYAELIMSPYGWTTALPADNSIFLELDAGQAAAVYAVHNLQYGYGPIYTTIYQASGGDVDWYYDHEGIFSFTTELRDTGTYGFELPASQIIPTCEENFAAAMYLANWSSSPVKISFPNGLPGRLTPNTPQALHVKVMAVGATLDPASPTLYARVGPTGTFTAYPLTSVGNNIYDATLPATPCGRTLYYYVSAATTTGITGYSPADAPTSTYSVTAQPIAILIDANMDTNPGWTADPLWAWGHPTGGGGEHGSHDPTGGFTGTNVYGYNLSGDYANNLGEKHLTTPSFNCAGKTGVRLGFYRWLGVEQPSYDHAYIRISTNNGSTWTTVWQNTAEVADSAWVYQEYDLSQWANNQANVKLRWTMGTTDTAWVYCGWNIDDVLVWANDPAGCPPGCPGDTDCNGQVGFSDIDYFVAAIPDNQAAWQALYADRHGGAVPPCPFTNCDANGDGNVNFADIDPFVALIPSTCP